MTLRKGTGPPTKTRWAGTWGSRSITHRCPTLPTGKAISCPEHSLPELCIQPLTPLATPWPQKAMVWPPKDLASSPERGGDCFLPTEAAVHCGIKQASLLSKVISSSFLKSFQVPSPESPYSDRLKGSGLYREDGLLVPCCVSPAPLSHMTWQDGDLLREASPARSAGAHTANLSNSSAGAVRGPQHRGSGSHNIQSPHKWVVLSESVLHAPLTNRKKKYPKGHKIREDLNNPYILVVT